MASYNRVILIGNATRDPELRNLPSGAAVAEVGLAVNDRRKNASGNWVDETTFVDVTMWNKTAEFAGNYLRRGSPVLVEGRLKADSWESKDGQKRTKLKVVADKLVLLRPKGDDAGPKDDPLLPPEEPQPSVEPVNDLVPVAEDDIPF